MTGDQWTEVMDWVKVRFPTNEWHPEQAVAYFDDLAQFDATDVWAGLIAIYEQGSAFAPTGSQLVAAAKTERRKAAEADRYRALPEPKGVPYRSAENWVTKRFGVELSTMDAIRRIHAEQKSCGNPSCDMHQVVVS